MKLPFESKEAQSLNVQVFETIYYGALEASCELAQEHNAKYETYEGSPISEGVSGGLIINGGGMGGGKGWALGSSLPLVVCV